MASIIITATESDNQLISGFPEFVTLETNTPTNIYYTIDETDPTEDSEFYIDFIRLPTTGLTLTIKIIAMTDSMSSDILELNYNTVTDFTRFGDIRNNIDVLPYDEEPIAFRSYDEDGNHFQESAVNLNKLDFKTSTRNHQGEQISGESTIDFINFATPIPIPVDPKISRLSDANFNPRAQYLMIDGSTEAARNNQVLTVINRSSGTMSPNPKLNNFQLVSSNALRYQINPNTGIICFYYFDSRNNKWIVSKQSLPETTKSLNLDSAPQSSPPSSFVFRWIENRVQSWK